MADRLATPRLTEHLPLAAFLLSLVVVVGAFILIALEKETQIDTAMVGIISSVVTAWASYFAHLGGSDSRGKQ